MLFLNKDAKGKLRILMNRAAGPGWTLTHTFLPDSPLQPLDGGFLKKQKLEKMETMILAPTVLYK